MTKKNAIVTGGSRGIGEGLVLTLAKLGYNVTVNYVSDSSKEKADNLINKIRDEYGVDGLAVQADVSDYNACKSIIDKTVEKFGKKIDVLVNNAGIDCQSGFLKTKPEQYKKVIDVNLMSYFHCSHLVLPMMVEANEGQIINISSIAGSMGFPEQADYCASKSGILGLTRALAMEFSKYNIRINTISPGMIWTDMLRGADQNSIQALKQAVPLGDIGEVEDINGCLEYLLGANYMTGQNISPNGGIFMQ